MGRASTVLAAVAGPAAALAYEGGWLSFGAPGSLAQLVPVVLVAVVGLGVGGSATRRPPRWLGITAVVANGAVVALYGFLLLFFGWGGSR